MRLKLTKECVFSVNNKLIKQIDVLLIRVPMSLLFSDIYVSKMEKKLLIYEDDMYIPREKNEPDSLFEKLNSYHANTILTIEKNPTKFLGTKII